MRRPDVSAARSRSSRARSCIASVSCSPTCNWGHSTRLRHGRGRPPRPRSSLAGFSELAVGYCGRLADTPLRRPAHEKPALSPHYFALLAVPAIAQTAAAQEGWDLDAIASGLESKVIEWRRDFHQNPELSNPRVPHRRRRRRASGSARYRSHDRRRPTPGVVGILRGRATGSGRRPSAPTWTPCRCRKRNDLPFPVRADWRVSRRNGAGHACVRSRHAHRHPDGGCRGLRCAARAAAGNDQVHLPARRRRHARGRGRRGPNS